MNAAAKRAEVVAEDQEIAGRFRDYLEDLDYAVGVTDQVDTATAFDVDLVLYHVAANAVRAERRTKPRGRRNASFGLRFWLDVVQHLAERSRSAQVVVALPPGASGADMALESGATDVIDASCPPLLFRRRIELLEFARDRTREKDRAAPGLSSTSGVSRLLSETDEARREPRLRPTLELPLPELRNKQSGRLDAREVAYYMGVSLKQLAKVLEVGYPGLHKTPDSPRLQETLRPIVNVLELAYRAFGNREQVRMWLNRALHELDDESPLAVMLSGEADAVETLLKNALTGISV